MISTPDRQTAVALIDEARSAGARLRPCCQVMGITARTYQRWTQEGEVRSDRRPEAVRPLPSHALTPEERAAVLAVCNTPENASRPPEQIVPALADEGVYLASESTFYRILRDEDQQHNRGGARKPSVAKPPVTHCATAPNTVWCWDITWLPAAVRGRFFFLYMIMNLYSRKIVGWEAHENESAVHMEISSNFWRLFWRKGHLLCLNLITPFFRRNPLGSFLLSILQVRFLANQVIVSTKSWELRGSVFYCGANARGP